MLLEDIKKGMLIEVRTPVKISKKAKDQTPRFREFIAEAKRTTEKYVCCTYMKSGFLSFSLNDTKVLPEHCEPASAKAQAVWKKAQKNNKALVDAMRSAYADDDDDGDHEMVEQELLEEGYADSL